MKGQELRYESLAKAFLEQLPKGAFMSVHAEPDNTMTIGWGALGYMWKKPVLVVMVRPSRHTCGLVDEEKAFTVSVPLDQDLQDELLACGRHSGRDGDKFERFGLDKQQARALLDAPIVGDCSLHYECRVLLRQPMDPSALDDVVRESAYPNGDYHVLYFAEILDTYVLQD